MKKYVTEEFRGYDIPDKPANFIAWFQEKVAATGVPPEDICVEIDAREEYGDAHGQITLSYEREETRLEQKARKDQENRRKDWELKELARLEKKYGKTGT